MSTAIKPRKALNKAYLKVKPNRADIEVFKSNLITLLDHINDAESEEFHKNLVSRFLENTYYNPNHFINTKGRNDLVIHNGKDAKSNVGVIIEAKKPSKTGSNSEMIRHERINTKAMQELVLYFLRERITHKNLEIKYLVATDIYNWFIFDATVFEKAFAQNKNLVRKFVDFEEKRLAGQKTDFFYKEIAEPAINLVNDELDYTYFNLKDYETALRNSDKSDDVDLIVLYKLLSPEHLLKLPFANDSNSLNKQFYNELLHIIGLIEIKDGNKRFIGRKPIGQRNNGSLIENAIKQLDSMDKISRLKNPSQFGANDKERLYNVALELAITWINRILFLKLLEAQLIGYHRGNRDYSFLNSDRIHDFDDLNTLFFSVLARKFEDRDDEIQEAFPKVPYLNSSLFDPTEIEQVTIVISNLRDDRPLPILPNTVLKDVKGKKRTGDLNTLNYIFEFLNAYDFGSESSENIQEDNKTLINASVLGLIFEKINGYKEGSFFTPGFITMYMCRETIRQAVLQKFNEVKGWNCSSINTLYDKIEDKKEANSIINSLKICDPAVGSGHFLVSALNEIISIKADLHVLLDRQGKTLRDYTVEVANDELILTDDDGKLFEYHPGNNESQRIQEALFHEKQTIIESCLFGVDINPNSVKICRLRLWIELLKNSYYNLEPDASIHTLETLPNIDINIKNGNSLISRFPLDSDIRQALKKSKWNITSYRAAVQKYRNPDNKDEKRRMEKLIDSIKKDFRKEISNNDPKVRKLRDRSGELNNLLSQTLLFKETKAELKARKQKQVTLENEIDKLTFEIEEIKSNKIYEDAFEWRFEFPEVLDDNGNFVGFDVVIGNPPYINAIDLKKQLGGDHYNRVKDMYSTAKGTADLYIYFFELGYKILKDTYFLSYITPNRYLSANYGEALREFLTKNIKVELISDFSHVKVFDEAATYPILSIFSKSVINLTYKVRINKYNEQLHSFTDSFFDSNKLQLLEGYVWGFLLNEKLPLTEKIILQSVPLNVVGEINATSTASEADLYHELINGNDGYKLINTDTIDRYSTTWGINRLIDKGEKYTCPHLPKDSSVISQNRHNLYSSSKIILAKIALSCEGFYDEKGEFASINTNCIHSFKATYNPKYVLAWVNSRLFQYTFECFFDGLKMAGGYLLYSAPNVQKMFIKELSIEEQSPFVLLVNRILHLKEVNPGSDTSDLEKQIDLLFYKAFSLSEDEISILNNSPVADLEPVSQLSAFDDV